MRLPALQKTKIKQKKSLSQILYKFVSRNFVKRPKKRYYPVPSRK